MGDLKVTIEHGSGSRTALWAVIGGLFLAALGGETAAGVASDLSAALLWVGGTLAVAVAGLSVFLIRAMRRRWRPGYVRSMHGPTERDRQLDQMAEKKRELDRIRRLRLQMEDGLILHGSITGRMPRQHPGEAAWQAPFVSRSGLYQQLPPIPGHEG